MYVLSNYSLVGIATGYVLDDRGVGVRVTMGSRVFSPLRRLDRMWGPTEPPIQWVKGTLCTLVKRPRRETNHWLTSAELKKCGSIQPVSHMSSPVMNWCILGPLSPSTPCGSLLLISTATHIALRCPRRYLLCALIHGHACWVHSHDMVSESLQLTSLYPWTHVTPSNGLCPKIVSPRKHVCQPVS
jgi:hypothetical protein